MAMAAGLDIEVALVATDLGALAPAGVDVLELSPAAFRKLSVRNNPDGLAVVAARIGTDVERLAGVSLVLVAEGMEKPGNIGAMMRTADAAGAGVLLASAVADVFNPNVIRASQGALFTVPVAVADAAEARSWLEERIAVVVATPQASGPYWDFDLSGPTAIVVGAEHEGISPVWDDLPAVRIPMVGAADSLNASVAAAVLLFEAVRQRAAVG